ncbi:hypothetical protein [Kribbella sp. HUAS MG21]|jgi:hypothetical protein|uniref:Uncharacterized protein n=1 Tax=Kribbella sp. HUAS MG21 TaxID=3160966 RepID=A0AAU7TIE3_9ACTN
MNLTDMSERAYWAEFAKRPGMFIGGTGLRGIEAYLMGYDAHSERHGGPGLQGWTEWLTSKLGYDCNHTWPGKVRHLALTDPWPHHDLSAEQEHQVTKTIFELLDQFLSEREPNGDPDPRACPPQPD